MKILLSAEEEEFARFLVDERRSQIKAARSLWERHAKNDGKRILDNFPYEKGEAIPYVRSGNEGSVLIWDPETHKDLAQDVRDHLEERTNWPERGDVKVAHGLLKKIEAKSSQTRSKK